MSYFTTLVERCRATNSLLADELDAEFRRDWARIRQEENRIVELEAKIEKLEVALSRIAGKNNLEGVQDDLIWSAMANALQECELISREALG